MSLALATSSDLRVTSDGTRSRLFCATDEYTAALGYYPAGIYQPEHEHSRAQLSFLLCGGYAETERNRDYETTSPLHKFRPAGSRHSADFGRFGALIFSVDFYDPSCVRAAPEGWHANGRWVTDLCRLIFTDSAPADEVVDDLIGGLEIESAPGSVRLDHAPIWLRRAAERFADDPLSDVSEVAYEAGVHRVHLSRAFRKYLGLSPSHYRLFCKTTRALHRMIDHHESPAMAAASAGFADQAHWTRASRVLAGVAPGQLRMLLFA